MDSEILKLGEDGKFSPMISIYSLGPREALVCYLEQTVKKNNNTWQYWDATKSEFYQHITMSVNRKCAYYDDGKIVTIARLKEN